MKDVKKKEPRVTAHATCECGKGSFLAEIAEKIRQPHKNTEITNKVAKTSRERHRDGCKSTGKIISHREH